MKVNLPKLDKSVLADFYGSPEYKSLLQLMELEKLQWAQDAIYALDQEHLREIRGKINAYKNLEDFLKTNHKTNTKKLDNLVQ